MSITAFESDGKNPLFEIDGCDTVRCSARSIFPSEKTRFLRLMVVTLSGTVLNTLVQIVKWFSEISLYVI